MSEFVEVRTSELAGQALDWAVAKAEGMTAHVAIDGNIYASAACWIRDRRFCAPGASEVFKPSTDWTQGGPLLDKYDIALNGGLADGEMVIYATLRAVADNSPFATAAGPTRLIAVCRAIVAAKLGDVVQVPAELVVVDS